MAAPWQRLVAPPSTGNRALDAWLTQVANGVNGLPSFSLSSTSNGPQSKITADSGTLLIDAGSSATTFWAKLSGTSNAGWQALAFSPLTYGDMPGGVGARSIFDHYVDANNATTTETDLYSDTLTAGRLAVNGEKLLAQYGGVFSGAVSSTQRVRAYFGGTLIIDTGALNIGVATPTWDLDVAVIRVSSSVVRCTALFTSGSAALADLPTYTEVTGLTLANTQILKVTGTAAGVGAASNQITAKQGFVQWLPAAA